MNPLIVVVGYNRKESLLRLLNSIEKAVYDTNDVTLMISLDRCSDGDDVLQMTASFNWSHGRKIVRTFKKRLGLKKHIIYCGDLAKKYGAVVVLEDDMIVSPGFYKYTCQALEYYKDRDEIAGISLYSHEWNGYSGRFFQPVSDEYDTYLGQYCITWGQCWTDKGWSKFRTWYDEHKDRLKYNINIPKSINYWGDNSWGKYYSYYITEKNLFYVIPRVSFSTNYSEVGEHTSTSNNDYQVRLFCGRFDGFRFAPVEKACRYDLFFENMRLAEYLDKRYVESGIDIDLNNSGRNNRKNRYILSTAVLPYDIVQKYGLQLRPIDMNVILNNNGEGIYLYDKKIRTDVYEKDKVYNQIIRYEIRGLSLKHLMLYCMEMLFDKFLKKFRLRHRNSHYDIFR